MKEQQVINYYYRNTESNQIEHFIFQEKLNTSLKFLSLYLSCLLVYTEKVGDVLRYTSQWTMGLPQGDGAVSTVASFAGGISWQCSLFDVMKSKDWPRVIEALTSNVEVSEISIYIFYCFHF